MVEAGPFIEYACVGYMKCSFANILILATMIVFFVLGILFRNAILKLYIRYMDLLAMCCTQIPMLSHVFTEFKIYLQSKL